MSCQLSSQFSNAAVGRPERIAPRSSRVIACHSKNVRVVSASAVAFKRPPPIGGAHARHSPLSHKTRHSQPTALVLSGAISAPHLFLCVGRHALVASPFDRRPAQRCPRLLPPRASSPSPGTVADAGPSASPPEQPSGGAPLPPDDPSALLQVVRGFERRVVTSSGLPLVVRPLAGRHVEEATDLLTDSFVDLLGPMTYRPLLRLEIKVYVARCLASVPDSVLLVAVEEGGGSSSGSSSSSSSSDDGSSAGGGGEEKTESGSSDTPVQQAELLSPSSSSSSSISSSSLPTSLSSSLPPPSPPYPPSASSAAPSSLEALTAAVVAAGQTYASADGEKVVAVVQLFLTLKARPSFFLLEPPPSSVYLCNMAVLPAVRRRGCGAALLSAAEALASLSGAAAISLHCRLQDTAPLTLYRTRGYQLLKQDGALAPLLTWQWRRALLQKELPRPWGGVQERGGEGEGEEGEGAGEALPAAQAAGEEAAP